MTLKKVNVTFVGAFKGVYYNNRSDQRKLFQNSILSFFLLFSFLFCELKKERVKVTYIGVFIRVYTSYIITGAIRVNCSNTRIFSSFLSSFFFFCDLKKRKGNLYSLGVFISVYKSCITT